MRHLLLLISTFFTRSLLFGQLSGLYTINAGSSASASNFTSFTSFAASINSVGVSGAVTVNVVANSGPYAEQIQLNQITGASATNSILINGNANVVTYSTTNGSQPWTILLSGTDFLTFNNLTVKATDASNAFAMDLTGGADYNTFINCTFEGPQNSNGNTAAVLISGNPASTYGGSNSGNYNLFTNCTMRYGNTSVYFNGPGVAPFTTNNTFSVCTLSDWYWQGLVAYNAKNLTVTGCTIERPNLTQSNGGYGITLYSNQGAMINGNRIRKFWGTVTPSPYSSGYGISAVFNPSTGIGAHQNNIQNNILSDFNESGTFTVIVANAMNGFIQHNTIVLNNAMNTYTGSNNAIDVIANTANPITVKNNLISITQGGPGPVYAIYYQGTVGVTSNYNNYYINRSGTNYVAYYGGNRSTVSNLIAAGSDANSVSVDPLFLSPLSGNYMPSSYLMNNSATPVGITTDILGNTRGVVPDIGAIEFLNNPCTGSPALTSVITPSYPICPGITTPLYFNSTYSLSGITVQWQASTTSSLGPWTSIPGATNQAITSSTISQTTWYSAVVTCTNGNSSTTLQSGQLQVVSSTTNTAPYFEGFENITGNNLLPNCSWTASNPGNSCITFSSSQMGRAASTGSKFAGFYNNTAGVNYFYSNGILLNAGVTYSSGLMYQTETGGYTNWTNLSLLIGTTQTSTGLVTIASTTGAANSATYASLSNTFTVASSGIYYLAVRATSNGSCCASFLTWDDLYITIPCSLNSPTISTSASSTIVCSGQSLTLTVSGANTYTWSNGANSSSLVLTPSATIIYSVSGTRSISSCSTTITQTVSVNPLPVLSVTSSQSIICNGQNAVLFVAGASTYSWSTGATGAAITVSPAVTTLFVVTGTNTVTGCSSSNSASILVNQPTPIAIVATTPSICAGGQAILTAFGAGSYFWSNGANTQSIAVSPLIASNYTVYSTNIYGCVSSATQQIMVSPSPTITATASQPQVCAGETLTLNASGAAAYVWSFNTATVAGAQITSVPFTNTSYTVNGINNFGCSNSAIVNVTVTTVSLNLSSSASICCIGDEVTLTASGASTYSWSNGGFGTSITVIPAGNTSYTVNATDNTSGCSTSAVIYQVANPCLGIKETIPNTALELKLLPNPNNGRFSIELGEKAECVIFNALGQIVSTHQLLPGLNPVVLTDNSKGVYVVSIILNKNTFFKKVVIQ